MIAVRILVSYSSDLAQLDVRIIVLVWILSTTRHAWSGGTRIVARLSWAALLCEVLAGKKKHLFVEAADDRNFGLLLHGLSLRCGLRYLLLISL